MRFWIVISALLFLSGCDGKKDSDVISPSDGASSNSDVTSLCKGSIKNLISQCSVPVPDWLTSAETENETVEITSELKVIWHEGHWIKGTWEDGTWNNGTWKRGDWNNGIWHNGTWIDGIWHNGTWNNGTWKTGAWINGIWHNGTWEDGWWKNGIWKGGQWIKGLNKPEGA